MAKSQYEFWKRILETNFGNEFWKRILENEFWKTNFGKRILENKLVRFLVQECQSQSSSHDFLQFDTQY